MVSVSHGRVTLCPGITHHSLVHTCPGETFYNTPFIQKCSAWSDVVTTAAATCTPRAYNLPNK